jgi:hypothetical protein
MYYVMNLPKFIHPAQMQFNLIPGQFLMSYWKGLSLSSPKLASMEDAGDNNVTAGKS